MTAGGGNDILARSLSLVIKILRSLLAHINNDQEGWKMPTYM